MAYVFVDNEILTAAKLNDHCVNPDDTGWVPVEVAAGYTAATPLAVRRIGDQVMWRGYVTGSGLATTGTKQIVVAANCPSWAFVSSYNYTPCPVAANPSSANAHAHASGANGLELLIGTAGVTGVWLAGLRYTA